MVPVEFRSIVASRRGIPAVGAVAVAFAFTAVGFGIDALVGKELTATFSALYFLGCVAAVLAVRQRALFTAVVQPPLIMAASVPIAAQFVSGSGTNSLRDMLLNVAIPLVDRFPVMLAATVVVLVLGAFRWMTAKASKNTTRPEQLRPTREPRVARQAPPPARGRRPDAGVEPERADITYQPSAQTRARMEARKARQQSPAPEPRRRQRQWGTPASPALATPNRVRNDVPSHPVRVRYRDEPRG